MRFFCDPTWYEHYPTCEQKQQLAEELELRFYEELEDWEIFVATREVVRPALELLLIEEIPHRRWSLLNLILAGLDDAACEQVGGLEDVWDQLMTETGREIENALATFLAEDQRNPKFNTRLRDFVRTRMGGEQPQADWLSSKPANLIIALLDLPDSERAVVLGDLLANCDWEHMVALIGVIKCTGPTAQNLLAVLEHCHNPSYFWAVVDELRVRGLDQRRFESCVNRRTRSLKIDGTKGYCSRFERIGRTTFCSRTSTRWLRRCGATTEF